MKKSVYWMVVAALLAGTAFAEDVAPASKAGAEESNAKCSAAAKKAGLSGEALDDYVKQCISRGGSN